MNFFELIGRIARCLFKGQRLSTFFKHLEIFEQSEKFQFNHQLAVIAIYVYFLILLTTGQTSFLHNEYTRQKQLID